MSLQQKAFSYALKRFGPLKVFAFFIAVLALIMFFIWPSFFEYQNISNETTVRMGEASSGEAQ